MARIDVMMPQMGESIAEGTLSRWLKKVGDEVKRDEPIFEISTDKVDAEIPAPAAGVIAEILIGEGQTVPVQTIVARLETETGAVGVGGAAAVSGASSAAAAPPHAAPAAASSGTAQPSLTPATASPSPGPAVTPGMMPAAQSVAGTTPSGDLGHSAAPVPGSNGGTLEERLRTRSSPLVRRIAAEHGIELGGLHGTGIQGRVTKRDILGLIASGTAEAAAGPAITAPGAAVQQRGAPPSMHAPTGADVHAPAPEPWPGDVVEPMSVMRQRIMEHMAASRRTSAHVTSFMEVDLTRIARIRSARRAAFEAASGQKLTYLPFIIRSVVDALKQFPVMNASVSGANIIYRKQVNIGIAVALEWGLLVPVIKHADDLSVTGLTRALNDLAARARAKKLSPEEVQGGTFTITNPGVFGSLMGTPIISQPQVGILGIGAIEKRPKVVAGPDGEDTIAIRTCAFFSISFDHRIIDGAVADQFLAAVKRGLEQFPDAEL